MSLSGMVAFPAAGAVETKGLILDCVLFDFSQLVPRALVVPIGKNRQRIALIRPELMATVGCAVPEKEKTAQAEG